MNKTIMTFLEKGARGGGLCFYHPICTDIYLFTSLFSIPPLQHFALSLGRHGVDFRPLLTPIFERACVRLFSSRVSQATKAFVTELTTVTLTAHVAIPDSDVLCTRAFQSNFGRRGDLNVPRLWVKKHK